jgi:hypothetical protein
MKHLPTILPARVSGWFANLNKLVVLSAVNNTLRSD